MKAPKWLVFFVLLILMSGCSYVEEYRDIIRSDTISKEYFNVLNRHTREKTLYAEFETRVRIVATWKTRAFSDAYLSEYARLYLLPDRDKKERQAVLSEASSDFSEFLFYAYTPDRESNDFSKADSIWKVFFIGEGGKRLEPLEIREIKATPLLTKLFPYVKPYGKCYGIKFPFLSQPDRPDMADQSEGALVFTGILGKVELNWHGGKNR